MYTAQNLSERIKTQAKNKEVSLKDLLEFCDLNINSINQMSDKKGLSSFSLAKIADYLNCSVDYLLGRCDNPNVSSDTYINGNNNGIQAISKDNSQLTLTTPEIKPMNDTTLQLIKLVQSLPLLKQAEAIIYLSKLEEK